MIDKITAKIRRYPFQTGIAVGIIACLLFIGFVSLFQDHGRSLSGNSEIIQQDYLRMTINEYSRNKDDQMADWRYRHLGRKAGETLKLMAGDESISVQQLVSFAEAVGQTEKIGKTDSAAQSEAGTPANPRKDLSGFGKTLLIVLGLVVLAAAVLYVASLIRTKQKQKRRADITPLMNDEPMNMITPDDVRSGQDKVPDTLFDLDSLFPQGSSPDNSASEDEPEAKDTGSVQDPLEKLFSENDGETGPENESGSEIETQTDGGETKTSQSPAEFGGSIDELLNEFFDETINDSEEEKPSEQEGPEPEDIQEENGSETGLEYSDTVHSIDDGSAEDMVDSMPGNEDDVHDGTMPEPEQEAFPGLEEKEPEPLEVKEIDEEDPEPEPLDDNAEKPLVETDHENDNENEDELLKMIRGAKTNSEAIIGKNAEIDDISAADEEEKESEPLPEAGDESEKEDGADDDILIHYQSTYRIGNDMYDEVFSIDQGDLFRGECGIGIGETLNNTEPKAVTAFEVWLFDKDDIHTATWYLMSDFALENESIRTRLEQRGKCDRIRRNDVYTLETETLMVEIKVLELEYGTEMDEKNSYFTNVSFDVIARQKPGTGETGE